MRHFRLISVKQKPYPYSLIAPSADYAALCFKVVGFLGKGLKCPYPAPGTPAQTGTYLL